MPTSRAPILHAQPTVEFDTELFERRIREYAARRGTGGERLRVLEAGCGRQWSLDLSGVEFHLTGIDADGESMRLRRERMGDLDEAIVADLRRIALPRDSFDIAFCSFVLEHISGARDVLDRLVESLRPGGLLLVRVPDRDSVWGFVTRHTPHWLHVQYKRRIRGVKLAGTPGRGPFPVVYDEVVSWKGLTRYCAERGLVIEDAYASNFHIRYFGRLAPAADLALRAVALLSLRRLTADHNNIALVIRKPGDTNAG